MARIRPYRGATDRNHNLIAPCGVARIEHSRGLWMEKECTDRIARFESVVSGWIE